MNIQMPEMSLRDVPSRRWLTAAIVAVALALPCVAQAQVVVIANGSPITELDIQQRTKIIRQSTRKAPSRKDVIQELIDDRLKIAKAKYYGLEVSDKEVEKAIGRIAEQNKEYAAKAEGAKAGEGDGLFRHDPSPPC